MVPDTNSVTPNWCQALFFYKRVKTGIEVVFKNILDDHALLIEGWCEYESRGFDKSESKRLC
jgi:hypothetical protein